eukprot:CAMPEP_0168354052 /NCGR_PEP_ID=MMETSP0213-20121227/23646_1 /TAXON_ID=151035 /ORGANISM="Euplotes harpa, Strain FSP1.4" /LENGTH=50 /DNA_ID=CAMNT_0008365839 /DNA_START=1 /DNA_END=150 /DNA_ORIENTATION=+
MDADITNEDVERTFKQLTETEEIESILIDGHTNTLTVDPKVSNPLMLCGS